MPCIVYTKTPYLLPPVYHRFRLYMAGHSPPFLVPRQHVGQYFGALVGDGQVDTQYVPTPDWISNDVY